MTNDYVPITAEGGPIGGLVGMWWRKAPYAVRKREYAPFQAEGVRGQKVKADIVVPTRPLTDWEKFVLNGIDPPLDVVPTGDEGEWYAPMEEPSLLGALIDVGQGRLKPLEFANGFGLLGYDKLVPPANRCGGDPLDWFMAHARTVLTVAGLIRGLKQARDGGPHSLAWYLQEKITKEPLVLGGRTPKEMWFQLKARTTGARSERLPRRLVQNTIAIVRYLLNENLGITERRLQFTEQRGLRTVFAFRALIHAIYWQLADQLGQNSIHQCAGCGRIFIHSNVRARFCPPDAGKTISRCKSLWNVRAHRKRKRRKRKRVRG